MDLVINDDNLQVKEVHEFNSKVRALLIDEENKVLVANYGGVFLLPGGSIEKKESIVKAIVRELKEETGQDYKPKELSYLACLEYFQRNYPKRDGTLQNRIIKTYYFVANFKGVSKSDQVLSVKEKKDNFTLELVSLDNLEKAVSNNSCDNPRNIFFQKELLTIIKLYKDTQADLTTKKLQLK